MEVFQYLKFIPLLTQLITFVRQAQEEIRGSDSGVVKFQWVTAHFSDQVKAFESAGLIKSDLAAAILAATGQLVELVVQIMKAVHGEVPPLVVPPVVIIPPVIIPPIVVPPASGFAYDEWVTDPGDGPLANGDVVYSRAPGAADDPFIGRVFIHAKGPLTFGFAGLGTVLRVVTK